MALVITQQSGAIDYGVIAFTGLATGLGLVAFPPATGAPDPRNTQGNGLYPVLTSLTEKGRGSLAVMVNGSATQVFNLDYQYSADNGVTWVNAGPPATVTSSTVTVDGGAAGFTQAAHLDVQVGYQYRVMMFNNSGSTLNGTCEWRLYSDNS